MTKIITRCYETGEKARIVRHELIEMQKFSPRIIGLYDSADGLVEKLTDAHVQEATAKAYENVVKTGGAVVLVRAGYRPLGVAQTTRDIAEDMGALDMGDVVEEVYIKDEPERFSNSILLDHPKFLTRDRVPGSTTYHMANWPIPLISRRKPLTESIIKPHAYMANWPIGHLVPHDVRYGRFPFDFLIPGHKFQAGFPIGHLVPHNVRYGRFPFGLLIPGNKFMANWPIGHLIPGHKFMAKFPFGHLVPNGMRMANWPFPLLINGKTGTNSLVPGQKYMAKFPFDHLVPHNVRYGRFPFGLLVPGNKFMAKFPFAHIVPGHKFMAKFPFAHIVPGHKYMAKFPFGHIVPGHKYMANWIWPHTKKAAN